MLIDWILNEMPRDVSSLEIELRSGKNFNVITNRNEEFLTLRFGGLKEGKGNFFFYEAAPELIKYNKTLSKMYLGYVAKKVEEKMSEKGIPVVNFSRKINY